jgi:hypothetical protein
MAYVQNYQFDLFVSYAHVDNTPMEPADHGWVDALVRILESALNMKLGRRDIASIWRDSQSLRGNHEVTGHINEQVKRSALLLVVLSPGYLSSEYCLKELQTFVANNPSDRIFVVYKDPIDENKQKMPSGIRDLRKYNFWIPDRNHKPRVLGWPLPQHDASEDRQLYYPKVDDLSADILVALDATAAGGGGRTITVPPTPPPGPRKGTVLLAEVTDDLDTRREELRRYLDQAGIDVLPSGTYRLTRAEFEQAFLGDLRTCRAFVQLLGPLAGRAPPDIEEGFGRFQLELAKTRQLPILQWRSPDLDMTEVASPMQRALLQAAEVQAMPFEEFKRSVVDLFVEVEPSPPKQPSFLFVDADKVDLERAQSLVTDLGDAIEWEMPLYDPTAKAEDLQNDIEARFVECDALVVLYGEAGAHWVMRQLQLFRKLKHQRTKTPRLLAVVQAVPHATTVIPMKLQGLTTLSIDEARQQIRTSLAL